jgi:hypothetical protein
MPAAGPRAGEYGCVGTAFIASRYVTELSQISQCEIPGFFGLPAITAISTD